MTSVTDAGSAPLAVTPVSPFGPTQNVRSPLQSHFGLPVPPWKTGRLEKKETHFGPPAWKGKYQGYI